MATSKTTFQKKINALKIGQEITDENTGWNILRVPEGFVYSRNTSAIFVPSADPVVFPESKRVVKK